jgi:hypothetical protein
VLRHKVVEVSLYDMLFVRFSKFLDLDVNGKISSAPARSTTLMNKGCLDMEVQAKLLGLRITK